MNKKTTNRKKYNKKTSIKTAPLRPATANRAKKTSKNKPLSNNNQVLSVIFFGLALLIFMCSIIPGKNIWFFFHNLMFGLFSKGIYFLPFVFLYIAIIYAADKAAIKLKKLFYTTICLFILICVLVQTILVKEPSSENGIIEFITNSFNNGINKSGGGLFATIISWPLISLLGNSGATALISIIIFILIMIICKITLIDLFKAVCSPAKKIENIYSEHKKSSNVNIDIPLADFPKHPVESNKSSFSKAPDVDNFTFTELTNEQPLKAPSSFITPNINMALDDEINNQYLINCNNTEDVDNNISNDIEKIAKEKMEHDLTSTKEDGESDSSLSAKSTSKETNFKQLNINSKIDNVLLYKFPDIGLLEKPVREENGLNLDELKITAKKLVDTLQSFGVSTKLLDFSKGPTVTRYELQPDSGVKISKITSLADDIALNLAASGVRIEAPIPNKPAVGIEVPNKTISIVNIKKVIDSTQFKNNHSDLAVALGQDISGNITIADIEKMPHLLIAGSTGSGKSVCINSIIISLIYKSSPENVRLLMIDPKVVELGCYNNIPHLLVPVVTDPKKASGALNWAVGEMEKRYKIFAEIGVRDLKSYNKLAEKREDLNPLPKIVIIIDELADLMMTAPNEVEESICRLAQKARASGMHLVIATQRPSVDVITGIIKANIPSRIAFAVSSQIDSRTILDSTGAEKLLGRGDMLFFPMGYPKPIRIQGCFVSDKEVEKVVNYIKTTHSSDYDDDVSEEIEKLSVIEKSKGTSGSTANIDDEDAMLPKAIECALENGEISTSYLQRKLKLGYSRAARLIDDMEAKGIIGPKEGSKPRQILISKQQYIEMNLNKTE